MTKQSRTAHENVRNTRSIHPTAQFNYLPRTIGCLLTFLILGSIFYDNTNYAVWGALIFHGLIWPHCAYVHARFSTNSKTAEVVNLLIDSFIIGMWTNIIAYRLWPLAALNIAILMDNMATGGLRLLLKGLFSTLVGVGLSVVLFGFSVSSEVSVLTGALSAIAITFFTVVVSYTSYSLTLRYRNAKKALEERTQELQETRDALWGEMELAKKIQTVLLPTKPDISGLDISCYMQPADEVGGDYYDVINAAGKNWLVIGDVSGHGVSAGLIMMMVQTSINTAIEQNPEVEPSELLSIINRTIKRNIEKLDKDKYMTITLFAVFQEGRFFFSGLHQDILIYRSSTKTVDTVETDGVWIGLMNDISDFIKTDDLFLEHGDTMLLYTDGITEAWPRNSETATRRQHMFGTNTLIELLQAYGDESTERIKKELLRAFEDYDTDDDVTFMVIKRV